MEKVLPKKDCIWFKKGFSNISLSNIWYIADRSVVVFTVFSVLWFLWIGVMPAFWSQEGNTPLVMHSLKEEFRRNVTFLRCLRWINVLYFFENFMPADFMKDKWMTKKCILKMTFLILPWSLLLLKVPYS